MGQNFEKSEQIETILKVFKQINDQHVCLPTNTQHITMTTKQQQQPGDITYQTDIQTRESDTANRQQVSLRCSQSMHHHGTQLQSLLHFIIFYRVSQ